MPDPYEIALGFRAARRLTHWTAKGRNTDIDTGTDPEDIWNGSTALWVAPTQARIHDIASSSTNDDGSPAGTGAHYVTIYGLNRHGEMVSEEKTLNGTSNVATEYSYIMIYHMTAHRQYGSALAQNAGNIDATAQTDATVTCRIPTSMGASQMAVFQVPRGHTGYVVSYAGNINRTTATEADVYLYAMPHRSYVWQQLDTSSMHSTGAGGFHTKFDVPIPLSELTTVKLQAEVNNDNADLSGRFTLLIYDNVQQKPSFSQDIGQLEKRFYQSIS